MAFKNILLATDGSANAQRALAAELTAQKVIGLHHCPVLTVP